MCAAFMTNPAASANLETIAGANPKFTLPILFVHGLWCTAAAWRKFMGFCAHRGWVCHALSRSRPAAGLAACASELADTIASFETPPIVVGHDLGGWLALRAAASARAVVALAPIVPGESSVAGSGRLAGLLTRLWLELGRAQAAPEGRRGREFFARGVPGGTLPEPARLLRELAAAATIPAPPRGSPILVLCGAEDAVTPPGIARRLAERCGADFVAVPGRSHALPWADGWEQAVAEVHRWLVRSLGEPLLAFRDDEEDPDSPP